MQTYPYDDFRKIIEHKMVNLGIWYFDSFRFYPNGNMEYNFNKTSGLCSRNLNSPNWVFQPCFDIMENFFNSQEVFNINDSQYTSFFQNSEEIK